MTVADLAAQVVAAVMPEWRLHLGSSCVCGWDDESPEPFVNRCDKFGEVEEEAIDKVVPGGPTATPAFLDANPDLWTNLIIPSTPEELPA